MRGVVALASLLALVASAPLLPESAQSAFPGVVVDTSDILMELEKITAETPEGVIAQQPQMHVSSQAMNSIADTPIQLVQVPSLTPDSAKSLPQPPTIATSGSADPVAPVFEPLPHPPLDPTVNSIVDTVLPIISPSAPDTSAVTQPEPTTQSPVQKPTPDTTSDPTPAAAAAPIPQQPTQSQITAIDQRQGTDQGTQPLPKVTHLTSDQLTGQQIALQTSLEVGTSTGIGRTAEGTMRSITEHIQGGMVSSVRSKLEAVTDRQDQYNADPWAVYGGERALFCRIQYYHDSVEFSPQCELVDYNLVDPEYHSAKFNCQFFEQRGILYFYGERWMDCTPLSQRGKKVVFECGVQCAQRQGQSNPI